jgi:hypothetical protein
MYKKEGTSHNTQPSGSGGGTCALENIVMPVTTLRISAFQAPELARLPLNSHFSSTVCVSESSLLSLDR